MQFRRRVLALTLGALTTACGSTPTAPAPPVTSTTSTGTTSAGSTSAVTPALRGIVIDEGGQPVAGAEVTLGIVGKEHTVLTDPGGVFELPLEASTTRPLPVRAVKADFEPSWGWAGSSCCNTVRLYRIREIAPGDTVSLTLFNDAYCGRELEMPCRRVRLKSSATGRLTARVTPEGFGIVLADGVAEEPMQSSVTLPIKAESETWLDVWASSQWDGQGTGRGFTLTSVIE